MPRGVEIGVCRLAFTLLIAALAVPAAASARTEPVRASPCSGCPAVEVARTRVGFSEVKAELDAPRTVLVRAERADGSEEMLWRVAHHKRWGPAHVIPGRGFEPRLVRSPEGRTIGAWAGEASVRYSVLDERHEHSARNVDACTWDPVLRSNATELDLACRDDAGTPIEPDQRSGRAFVARWRGEDARFGAPAVVSPTGSYVRELDFALGADGRALLAWGALSYPDRQVDTLVAALREPGSTVWTAQPLGTNGFESPVDATIAVDGTARVVWFNGLDRLAATAPLGGPFGPVSRFTGTAPGSPVHLRGHPTVLVVPFDDADPFVTVLFATDRDLPRFGDGLPRPTTHVLGASGSGLEDVTAAARHCFEDDALFESSFPAALRPAHPARSVRVTLNGARTGAPITFEARVVVRRRQPSAAALARLAC